MAQPLVSPVFTETFFQQRAYDLSPEGSRVLSLAPETFFRARAVVDWVQQGRDTVRALMEQIDQTLIESVRQIRELCDGDPAAIDRETPAISYDQRWPATFVLRALMRLLVREAKGYFLKKGDGLDLVHAVIGAAYASVTTIDKSWKRRLVAAIPPELPTARLYYRRELDRLIAAVIHALTP